MYFLKTPDFFALCTVRFALCVVSCEPTYSWATAFALLFKQQAKMHMKERGFFIDYSYFTLDERKSPEDVS